MAAMGSATMGWAPPELGAQAKLLEPDELKVKPAAFVSFRAYLFLLLVLMIFSLISGMRVSGFYASFSLVWV